MGHGKKVGSHVVVIVVKFAFFLCALLQLETKKTKNKLLGFFLANAKRFFPANAKHLSLCQPQRVLSPNF
jgi:hypothetical protein